MKLKIREKYLVGKPYAGKVVEYHYNEDINELSLGVELFGDTKNVYSFNIGVDISDDSNFLRFCATMGVYDSSKCEIELDDFLEIPVVCTLAKDEKDNLCIDDMDEIIKDCYTIPEEFQNLYNMSDEEMKIFYDNGIAEFLKDYMCDGAPCFR